MSEKEMSHKSEERSVAPHQALTHELAYVENMLKTLLDASPEIAHLWSERFLEVKRMNWWI